MKEHDPMTRRTRAREVALQLLFEHDFGREFDREQLEEFARQPLEEPDEEYSRDALKDTDLLAFCLGLYDGVLANLEQIDERLSQLATNWRLPRMPFVDRNVLRLGAYELLHTPDTPPRVAIDEAIELARRFGSADSPSFVNGILDRVMND